ncbi:MAG: hypothetical protein K2J80_04360, partial [Oscillospiraceae bacterium]|nr:hypothetical protein [Oscillospiraceae bacterium]
LLCGCSKNAVPTGDVNNLHSSSAINTENVVGKNESDNMTRSISSISTSESEDIVESGDNIDQKNILSSKRFPQDLEEIPTNIFYAAQEQGTLVYLNYTTYESFFYAGKTQELQKRAVVYLPYGYNEQEKYNVFYLMHGDRSNETTTLGTPDNPAAMKNVLHNSIYPVSCEALALNALSMQTVLLLISYLYYIIFSVPILC